MRYTNTPLRPGLTAIAAVLALSSTPLFAQAADVAPAAPAVVTPPPVVTPAPTVAATPASLSSAPAPVSVDLGSSAAATEAAEPAQAAPATVRAKPAPATPRAAASTPRTTAPAPPVATPVAPLPTAAQAAPAPVAVPVVAPEPAPAPVATKTTTTTQSDPTGDILPIAGAAGAAALLLAGGALMLGRRRREREDVAYAPETVTPPVETVAVPSTATATAYAAPPMSLRRPEEVSANTPVTAIPSDFDMSRLGRHTQAAYRGPTPENPSLSLRRRLKRANFFDQRARMAARGEVPNAAYTAAPSAAPAAAQRHAEYVTTKAPQQPRPTFRPAYQS